MTSNRGAGFSSSPQRSRFDPLGQAGSTASAGLAGAGLLAGELRWPRAPWRAPRLPRRREPPGRSRLRPADAASPRWRVPAGGKRQEASPEEQARRLERQVHALLEESAACCATGDPAVGERPGRSAGAAGLRACLPTARTCLSTQLPAQCRPPARPPAHLLPVAPHPPQGWSARWRRGARSASCAACASRPAWPTPSSPS
jgi:hypothetical protein